jgi:hypothetical protein
MGEWGIGREGGSEAKKAVGVGCSLTRVGTRKGARQARVAGVDDRRRPSDVVREGWGGKEREGEQTPFSTLPLAAIVDSGS